MARGPGKKSMGEGFSDFSEKTNIIAKFKRRGTHPGGKRGAP